jgi:phosphatidate cytidylyltransferase
MSNLTQRLLTAIVVIPLLLVATWYGGITFALVVTFFTGVGLWEFYNIVESKGMPVMRNIGIIFACVMTMLAYFSHGYLLAVLLTIGIMVVSLNQLSKKDINTTINNISATIYGVIYVGWLLSHLILLRNIEGEYARIGQLEQLKSLFFQNFDIGIYLFVLALACTFLTDTGAYFAGRAFGKHKLAPVVSPKKTWEGAVGGAITSMVASVATNAVVGSLFPIWAALGFGFAIAVMGITGDLVESALKRDAKVKDSGILFPGHGGVMDRLDSVLFSLPTAYYYVKIYVFYSISFS